MKILIRLLAVWFIISVFYTVLLIGIIVSLGNFGKMLSLGLYAYITVIGWVAVLIIGPFAAIQMWRLKPSGRITAMILLFYTAMYYLIAALFVSPPGSSYFNKIVYITLN